MKRKVGTLIEESVVKMAKRRAAEEGRPLAEVIQDALVGYLQRSSADLDSRRSALARLLGDPLRLDDHELALLLENDVLADQIEADLVADGDTRQ